MSIIGANPFQDSVRNGKSWYQVAQVTRTELLYLISFQHASECIYFVIMEDMTGIPQPSHNMSRSLLIQPDIKFEIQRPNEKVVLIARKHPFTQLSWIFNALLLSLLAIILNFFLVNFFAINQIIVFNLYAIIFIFAYTWLNFLFWYFTVGIVTSERVLDLDFYNIVYKEFTATTIPQISELTTKVGGFFGSILDYGTVFVKTEGFVQDIEFQDVPQPSTIVKIINELNIQNSGNQN